MPFGLALGGIGAKVGKGLFGSITGGIFGKRSVYKFVPGKPPGAFRGAAARADYDRKMQQLGGRVSAMLTPGVLQKLSPVMPGGAIVTSSTRSSAPRKAVKKRLKRATKRRKRRTARRKLSRAQIAAGFGGRRGRRRRRTRPRTAADYID